MRNAIHCTKSNIIRGSITIALLLMLFTMMSSTAFAYHQSGQSTQSHAVTSLMNIPSGGGNVPSGNANLQWNSQTKVLTATVHLSGLQAGSSYANHIHAGNCALEGKLLYPFNNVVIDTTGNGASTTTINNITGGIPAGGWDIMVHNGHTAEASPILCGDVINTNGATSVLVTLNMVSTMHMH